MEQEQVYLQISPQVAEILADNSIDLERELRRQGQEVKADAVPDPAGTGQSKDVIIVLTILAATTTVAAVAAGVSRIIDSLSRRPVAVKNTRLTAVRDKDGNPVLDNDGNPVMEWIEESELLEPTNVPTDYGRIQASLDRQGLKIDLT